MGNLAIVGMFVFFGGLFFTFFYLQKRHALQKINHLMRSLASTFNLEYHSRPFSGWNQKLNYSDFSGSIDDRVVHGYVETAKQERSTKDYFCIEMACETNSFSSFGIYKQATFAKFAHQVFAHNSSDEFDDLVRAKYVFEAIPDWKLDQLLRNEVLCQGLLDVAELFDGEIKFHLGRIVYREEVLELDELKVNQMHKIMQLLLTTAEHLETCK